MAFAGENPPVFSEAVKEMHSWFESLTTNGFQAPSFKHLAVRPELRRRATAIFFTASLFPKEEGYKDGKQREKISSPHLSKSAYVPLKL
jgi:hypothetical protein